MSSFAQISQHVFLRTPEPNSASAKPADPTAILLLGWFFASSEHLQKYTDVYKVMFPAAPVIIVLPPFSAFFAPSSTLHSTLDPAFKTLSNLVPLSSPSTSLLIHIFSNGGALSLKVLEELCWTEYGGKLDLPVKGIIVDSAPNTRVGVRLGREIFKNKQWANPASVVVAGSYASIACLSGITGVPTPITSLSTYLLNLHPTVPRLFIYSQTDTLIPPNEIEYHIKLLRARGRNVRAVKYDSTGHVGHVVGKENKERYWNEVESFWKNIKDNERREGERKATGVQSKL